MLILNVNLMRDSWLCIEKDSNRFFDLYQIFLAVVRLILQSEFKLNDQYAK